MPKVTTMKAREIGQKSNEPLYKQIENDSKVRNKSEKKKKSNENGTDESMLVVDEKTSNKILKMIKEQQLEVEEGESEGGARVVRGGDSLQAGTIRKDDGGKKSKKMIMAMKQDLAASSDEEQDEQDQELYESLTYHGQDDDFDAFDDLGIDAKDKELCSEFLNSASAAAGQGVGVGGRKLTLSEMIMKKIEDANADAERVKKEKNANAPPGLNPKVIEVFTKVGMLLSRYKSGPLPKTFKIIPTLRDWEEVLYITNPAEWTPQAMYQATRIFTSNLKAKMAQRFFNLILLEKVRDDISETKKLNYHLYMALKKSLYKPAAFFKGFLLPLCEGGDCTLREAAIIGSVLVKVSVPVLHSAAALLKIAEMEYSGPNSLFIRILLDKKYALPFKVVDSLVFHYLAFKQDKREMPVLWHQSLLVFSQRYKEDMTPDQKEALLELIKVKTHFEISAEIRRELQNSVCRGDMKVEEVVDEDVLMDIEE